MVTGEGASYAWVGVRGKLKKKKKTARKKRKGKDVHCLQGSSIFLITMQHYRSKTVIKMCLTAMPQAVHRYSNATRQSRRTWKTKSETVVDGDRILNGWFGFM